MKKWLKWLFIIAGGIVAIILVYFYLNWPTWRILLGTEKLSGHKDNIPNITPDDRLPVVKGKTDWNSWLGPGGDNRSTLTGIKKDWSGGLKKLWEVNYLCQGNNSATWSAPVIQGNRLIIPGRNTDSDIVFALNPVSGKLLWKAEYKASSIANHGAGSRATPNIEGDYVYTFGRHGDLACWNLANGRNIWKKNVNIEGGKAPTWGHSSSPLILDNLLIIQGGGDGITMAFDKMTGKLIWKSGIGLPGYAAITKTTMAGNPIIITFHGKGFSLLDAKGGRRLWQLTWESSYDINATTPVIHGDKIFLTSGDNRGCALIQVGNSNAKILWENKNIAALHSDPFIIDGHIYGYSGESSQNEGVFKSITLRDGKENWQTNKMGWGTCAYVDSHLLCVDIKGNLFLMKPDPKKFIMVTQMPGALGFDIKGPVWTKPVVANGRLYLRFKQKLICYDLM